MLMLKEPVKSRPSKEYGVVLVDADGVEHFWLPDGTYDGHCSPCEEKAPKKAEPEKKGD